jgi:hypothetical protein
MKKFLDGKVVSGSRLFVGLLQLILVAAVATAQSPQAFTPTGNLNTGRNGQRAIPLNDGTILVTGGYDILGNGLASSELYHPQTGVFTTSPQEARILHDLVGFAGRDSAAHRVRWRDTHSDILGGPRNSGRNVPPASGRPIGFRSTRRHPYSKCTVTDSLG